MKVVTAGFPSWARLHIMGVTSNTLFCPDVARTLGFACLKGGTRRGSGMGGVSCSFHSQHGSSLVVLSSKCKEDMAPSPGTESPETRCNAQI